MAGDEALEKQEKENADLKKKVENAQAALMELTQENQSLQVRVPQEHLVIIISIAIVILVSTRHHHYHFKSYHHHCYCHYDRL